METESLMRAKAMMVAVGTYNNTNNIIGLLDFFVIIEYNQFRCF